MTSFALDGGSLWLQYLVAFSAAGAAAFAGWAAWTASSAATSTSELVKLERGRDAERAKAELWRQARSVTVDLNGLRHESPQAIDVHVQILNDGPDPIRKVRLRVEAEGVTKWGPQLLGTISPSSAVTLTVRIYGQVIDPNAYVRFRDVNRNYWVTDAKGNLKPDDRPTTEWIEKGRLWGERWGNITLEERGTVTGVSVPNFDVWLTSLQQQGTAPGPTDESVSPE
jgi:hypothetical protein